MEQGKEKRIAYIMYPFEWYGDAMKIELAELGKVCAEAHVYEGVIPFVPDIIFQLYLHGGMANMSSIVQEMYDDTIEDIFARKCVDELWIYHTTLSPEVLRMIRCARKNGIRVVPRSPSMKELFLVHGGPQ